MISHCFRVLGCLLLGLGSVQLQISQAQTPDAPEITSRGDVDLGKFRGGAIAQPLVVEALSVTVDVQAGLAQVSMLATLRNETGEDIEASFAYPLPTGAVINGYGLDIDGDLVDGVLMPKERAEALYTDRVTQSIDPGIAARTADNRYRTRIYPIAADGGRRSIRLDFAVPVPSSGLRLPLAQSQRVESINIKITGEGAEDAQRPIAGIQAKDVLISGDIFIPAAPSTASLSTHSDQTFLTLSLATQTETTALDTPSVAVIWDTSLSRQSDKISTEARFVGDVLKRLQPAHQSLIHGADQVKFAARYATPSELVAAIGRLTYDGATDLTALLDVQTLQRRDIQPDICVIVTDGRSTLRAGGIPSLPCRVFTFSADTNPNTDWLALLAAKNDGADLSGLGATEAARMMTTGGSPQLALDQVGELFSAGQRQWLILPIDAQAHEVKVKFPNETKRIRLRDLSFVKHAAAGSMWGQREIAQLRSRGSQAFDDIVDASRKWNVQTEETAFLVLEDASDYIEARIDPPRNFPADRMTDYKQDLAEMREDEAKERADHFDEIKELWEEQLAWWNGDWAKKPSKPQPVMEATAPVVVGEVSPEFIEADDEALNSDYADYLEPDTIVLTASRRESSDEDEIIVMGARRSNPAGTLPAEISITSRPWSPDRPYLTALANLDGTSFETAYREQRATYGDRPSFYLEVADQLHSKGNTARAASVATTALELRSATLITRANVADRLLMYGQTDTAIGFYRDVLPTSQDRPQPFYNLALALIQAGDEAKGAERDALYGEAFDHLIHIINSPWEDDYEGIHLIALQDLNRTLARLPKRSRRKFEKRLGLDKNFYQNLPVDIRVLIDWTADDADLDIHVIERVDAEDEELAYYSNPETERGGRVSNDMTEGYGPEEYMIRRAPIGLYRVESDYYAQDDYAEDGALKLRARLWRNFGRKTETFETVIIEMLEEKEEAYVLGEIKVGSQLEIDQAIAAEQESE